jgi:hypothetical protein
VEDNAAFACSQVIDAERLLLETLASVGQNILRLIRVSLKKGGKVSCAPPASFEVPYFLLSLFLQHLSRGNANVPALRVEVTWARKAAGYSCYGGTCYGDFYSGGCCDMG